MRILRAISPAKVMFVAVAITVFVIAHQYGQAAQRHYDAVWGKTQYAAITSPAIVNGTTSGWKADFGNGTTSLTLYRARYQNAIIVLPYSEAKRPGQMVPFWINPAGEISTTRADRENGIAAWEIQVTMAFVFALLAAWIIRVAPTRKWSWWGKTFFSYQWYPT